MLTLKRTIGALCLAAVVSAASISQAEAGHCYTTTHCYYKTVTEWVPKTVTYQKRVVRYRDCGTAYYAWETCRKTIKVPVTRSYKVCH